MCDRISRKHEVHYKIEGIFKKLRVFEDEQVETTKELNENIAFFNVIFIYPANKV